MGGLWITTAQELVAIGSTPEGREGLAKHLETPTELLSSIIDRAYGSLPKGVAGAMAEATLVEEFCLGALEPPSERRLVGAGPLEATVEVAALPRSVDLSRRMPPIRDQGGRGTCPAFAVTALNEFLHAMRGEPENLSEQFLYWDMKRKDGYPEEEGSFISVGMECAYDDGQCTEEIWPYNPNPPTNQKGNPPPGAFSNASHHKIKNIVRLSENSLFDIKVALAEGSVTPFAIPVFNSWLRSAATKTSGAITMPLPFDRKAGGHAMCFIGYQDEESAPGGGYFILRNSWGQRWGTECVYGVGNGTIPYAYVEKYCWEAYTSRRDS